MSEQRSDDVPLAAEQCRPTGLDIEMARQVLRITWADGVTHDYPAAFLRRHCPCAACRTEYEEQSRTLLPVLSPSQTAPVMVTGGHLVGNYALQLEWSDGHATGIYDFRLLRRLAADLPRTDG